MRIMKNINILKFKLENHKDHENQRISYQNHAHHENLRISFENKKKMKTIEFILRIMKIIQIAELQ